MSDNLSAMDLENSSMLDTSVASSALDTSMSAAVRNSRRRMKGSAVVLNTDRLQMYIKKTEESIDASGAESPTKRHMLGFKEKYKLKMAAKSVVDARIQEQKRNSSSETIARWWRTCMTQKQRKRTQGGIWSTRQVDITLAVLLGHRVRHLIRSPKVALNIAAQRDICKLLSDMYNSLSKKASSAKSSNIPEWELLLRAFSDKPLDDLLLDYPGVSYADLSLATSMCKQLLTERENLAKLVFGGARWRSRPSPGYWDLSAALQRAFSAARDAEKRAIAGASPGRRLSSRKTHMETPPNARRAVQQASSQGKLPSRGLAPQMLSSDVFAPGEGMASGAAASGEGFVNRLRHSGESKERIIEPQVMRTPDPLRADHSLSSISAPASGGGSGSKLGGVGGSSSQTSPQAQRQRASQRGHIQLHVLSADRLIPARKGAPVKDASGGTVADRIPCLKVKLLLPNWTAGAGARNQATPESGAGALKKVFEQTRDFTAVTLNPQWGAAFTLNLPCPRSVVQSIAALDAADCYSPNQALSERAYEVITRSLLQWWSLGTLSIEVFDGERFNQEIFMGFVDVLLSGFMVLIKKPDDLEIKGNFQLNKLKPSDRVTGSIKLQAFLHAPEKAFLAELLDPTTKMMSDKADRRSALDASDTEDADAPKVGSYATSSSNSSPDQPPPPPVYSSKFMQSLARQSAQGPRATSRGGDLPAEGAADAPSGVRTRSPAVVQGPGEPLADPTLEESENIHFGAQGGGPVSQRDISESARLLKEKLRTSKTARRPVGAPAAAAEVITASTSEVYNSQSAPALLPQSESPVRKGAAPASSSGSRIPTLAGAVNRGQKVQSMDSGSMRRRLMEDITSRLAGLSAVQESTDAVLDTLNYKLEAKLRSKVDVSVIADSRMPTDKEMSAALDSTPSETSRSTFSQREMAEIRRLMARAELQEPEDSEEEGEAPPPPPAVGNYNYMHNPSAGREGRSVEATSTPTRRALNTSYGSREDEDAPEIGALSEEEGAGSYDPSDSDGFVDTYEDEEHLHGDADDGQHEHAGTNVHTSEAYLGANRADEENGDVEGEDEYWEYQSDSEGDGARGDGMVTVQTVRRNGTNLAPPPPPPAPRQAFAAGPTVAHARDAQQGTIYAEESDEEAAGEQGEEEDGRNPRTDYSNMSSVYSNSIVEFLSPEPVRGSPRRHQAEVDAAVDGEDSSEELIVLRSSSRESGLGTTGGSLSWSRGSAGPSRKFEVQSAPSAVSPGRALRSSPGQRSEPSRSLFEATQEPLPTGVGAARASPARRGLEARSPAAGSASSSPYRVVLDLNDMEL